MSGRVKTRPYSIGGRNPLNDHLPKGVTSMATVQERFLKYVSFDTKSDEFSETCPSTDKQKILGAYLVEEMKAFLF